MNIGITLKVFNWVGKMPMLNERLKIYNKGKAIKSIQSLSNVAEMQFPIHVLEGLISWTIQISSARLILVPKSYWYWRHQGRWE